MFDYTSRYYSLPVETMTTADGQTIAYASRRFLPQTQNQTAVAQVTVADGDRLDLIAYRVLGDPLRFWQVCDSNNAMNPFTLLQPGETLQIMTITSTN